MPSNIAALRKHLDLIGMLKKTSKIHYEHDGHKGDLTTIHQKLRKRPWRAKISASTIVTFKNQAPAKIVFVLDRRKTDWLALLSTDIHMSDEDVV